jgi:Ca2+-binding RTX toxin-like protein
MDGGIASFEGTPPDSMSGVMDGDDSMDGGAGHDFLDGGEGGNDTLVGGEGNDTLSGQDGGDSLAGDAGNDVLIGGSDFDFVYGGAGNDTLYGGDTEFDESMDALDGGAGNDVYHASFSDIVGEEEGGGGIDRVFLQNGGEFDYFDLDSSIEHATVDGNGSLLGNESANSLVGGDGNSFLAGGGGNDTLTGGDGADQFILNGVGGGDLLTITDFDKLEGDSLGLDGEGFADILSEEGVTPGEVTNGTLAVGEGPEFVYKFSSGELFYDADGAGGAAQVLVAKFTGAKPISLTADDFSGWSGAPE